MILRITGLVQGVGFRPFVHRLATRHALGGWVRNDSAGVTVCFEGTAAALADAATALVREAPALARIDSCEQLTVEPVAEPSPTFHIAETDHTAARGVLVTPDGHVCADCLAELFDPADRRFRYPFINCTNCGPRFSIVESLPYDRPSTTMAAFTMCAACRAEYDDPADRRFHAQPNACPACGPAVALRDPRGELIPERDPVLAAVERLRAGQVLAVKALGGYQLMCDPGSEDAISVLRRHKSRSRKPFALLAKDVKAIREHAAVGEAERLLLESSGRPIVLLGSQGGTGLADGIAPGAHELGFMLPSTPLQHLLLSGAQKLFVATSGNARDLPMAVSEEDAIGQLGEMADAFLTHDRRIANRVDDSVARVLTLQGVARPTFIRRGRGHAPDTFAMPQTASRELRPTLALGPELKATTCLGQGRTLYLSPHIGDLKYRSNQDAFHQVITYLCAAYRVQPEIVAHDMHPDFYSTTVARGYRDLIQVPVQHHHAHMVSCMVDNGLTGPVIGVVFDGTGYGLDSTIWGGEFLVGDLTGFERVGHLRTFALPGGDSAIKHPARIGTGLLASLFGADGVRLPIPALKAIDPADRELIAKMVDRGVGAPMTSSMGRLFDAVSALLDVCSLVTYEGQAAIELEQVSGRDPAPAEPWPAVVTTADGVHVLDHQPWIEALLRERLDEGRGAQEISVRFHESIVAGVVEVCRRIRAERGLSTVVLSGGVFLNRYLTKRATACLAEAGMAVYNHHRIPPNDGGISVGQAAIAGTLAAG